MFAVRYNECYISARLSHIAQGCNLFRPSISSILFRCYGKLFALQNDRTELKQLQLKMLKRDRLICESCVSVPCYLTDLTIFAGFLNVGLLDM